MQRCSVRSPLVAALLSVLLLSACGGDDAAPAAAPTSEPTATATTSAPEVVPSSDEARVYDDAVQQRDAVVTRLRDTLADDTLDLPAFQAAGAEYATAVEAFDRTLAEATWPADVQPLVDKLRQSNVAEIKAARLMESALDETSAALATATVGEARRRGAVNDRLLRQRLGLPVPAA